MKLLTKTLCVVIFTLSLQNIQAQKCEVNYYANNAKSSLNQGYRFLKSFPIDGRGGVINKVEYSYVFSKDTFYQINIAAPGGGTDGIKVTLYDANRKKKGSSYVNGRLFKGFNYACPATGIYYITFEFERSTNYCGAAALGMKR